MKFLVLFSCALAVASAGLIAPIAYAGHGIHLPVIDVSGVPVDTAEVQNAKAAHATHYAVAATRAGAYEYAPYVAHAYAASLLAHDIPVVAAHTPVIALGHHAYPTTAVLPAFTADGVPLNTPEVAAATADHIAAHHEALGRVAHDRKRRGVVATAYAAPYAYAAYGVQHLPTIDASGVPVDTAEVQHAKAAHATHHAIAATRAGYEVPVVAPLVAVSPVIAHAAPWAHHVPTIAHDGTPLDTPEVAHAKAAHFAAYNEAAALNSVHPYVAAYAAPYAYSAPWAAVPADTPEVAQAKADHFAAHAAALANL